MADTTSTAGGASTFSAEVGRSGSTALHVGETSKLSLVPTSAASSPSSGSPVRHSGMARRTPRRTTYHTFMSSP